MNYKELRKKLKSEQISLINTHTSLKRDGNSTWSIYQEVRIKHIAYSMFRGSTYEQVESKWKEPLNSNNHYIKAKALKLYEEYKALITPDKVEDANETLCVSS